MKQSRIQWYKRRLVVFGCLGLALYFLTPVVLNAAARRLLRTDDLQVADVIIALGGDPLCLRERQAAELYHRGLSRKIVVAGLPFAWGGNTGEVKRRYLVCRGVAEQDVVVLKEARNTRAEAATLAELMQERGWQSAIVVTAPFHSRRALYTLECRAPQFKFYSAPLPACPPVWEPQQWWTRRRDLMVTLREFVSWGNTVAGGWQ